MALHDDLGLYDQRRVSGQHHFRPTATLPSAADREETHGQPLRQIRVESLKQEAHPGLTVLLLGFWIAAAYAGIVYWAVQGSLLGVFLSAAIPSLGAFSTLPVLNSLGNTDHE